MEEEEEEEESEEEEKAEGFVRQKIASSSQLGMPARKRGGRQGEERWGQRWEVGGWG